MVYVDYSLALDSSGEEARSCVGRVLLLFRQRQGRRVGADQPRGVRRGVGRADARPAREARVRGGSREGRPMYLIIDCETTGLPRRRSAPVTDTDNWPHVVQVAWMLYDESEELKERGSHLVRPNGFKIPLEAQRVHGITTERAEAEGMPLSFVLKELSVAAARCKVVVAHNFDFDAKVISAEYVRLGLGPPFKGKTRVCTMKGSTNFCRIPGPYGYKWPTLPELHHALFGCRCEETHDAALDVAACAKCFFELKRRGVLVLDQRIA